MLLVSGCLVGMQSEIPSLEVLGSLGRCMFALCGSWGPSMHLVMSTGVKVMLAKGRSLTEGCGQMDHLASSFGTRFFFVKNFYVAYHTLFFLFQVVYAFWKFIKCFRFHCNGSFFFYFKILKPK